MTEHYSPMSITQLINQQEECNQVKDANLATEPLDPLSPNPGTLNGNPKTGITLPPLFVSSSTTLTSPLTTPTSCISEPPRFSFSSDTSSSVMEEDYQQSTATNDQQQQQQQPFINRVSNISLVNSALRVYEQSTAQNVMKYGTDMVESFTGPIYDKLGKGSYTNGETQNYDEDTMAAVNALARTTLTDDLDGTDGFRRRVGSRLDDDNIRKTRSRPHSRSTSPHRPYIKSIPATRYHPRSTVNKSKWQQIVMHAGSAAGTTAAVVSEESMKCLRYCLHWLQYATQHIQQQMHILRTFLVSLATSSTSSNTKTVSRSNQQPSPSTLAAVQKEIVSTLRKVVEVVSRYAGVGLPTHAKASVRSFILQLPGRWATLNTSAHQSHDDLTSPDTPVPDHVKETSIKLLNFGGEAVEMLENTSAVFSDTIDRAEVWLDRLRVVGVAPVSQISPQQSTDQMES
ncbi:transcription factor Opi1-domain-containing protein [Chlamydoabsidia padenii]|nr:transcription factor Opi1-domain-containing protein [Chlamydoabsidia padenii]